MLTPSTERFMYGTFRRQYMTYRSTDLGKKTIDLTDPSVQLPYNSVLHMMDHVVHPRTGTIAPMPLSVIDHEDHITYMYHNTTIPSSSDPILPVTDRYRFVPASVIPMAAKYYKEHPKIRRPMSLDTIIDQRNILMVFNHNPLTTLYLRGRLADYHKTQIILKAVLRSALNYPDKLHYIHIPLTDTLFTLTAVKRIHEQVTTSTLRLHDSSFYLAHHLIGYCLNSPTSLFHTTPLTPETMHVIVTYQDQAVIYNLQDLKDLATTMDTTYLRVIYDLNRLRQSEVPEDLTEDYAPDPEVISGSVSMDITSDPISEPPIEDPTTYATPLKDHLDQQITTLLDEDVLVSKGIPYGEVKGAQKRIRTLVDQQSNLMIGDQSIASLISATDDPDINTNTIEQLKSLPDPSMASSRIANIDYLYIKDMLDRDIARMLISLTPQGLFLRDLHTEDIVTTFDRIRIYKAKYVDIHGQQHTITFKLPLVDETGQILVNGITSRMVKQLVNLPICKIAPHRVNLSSNFNKTLVERSQLVKSKISRYFKTYIDRLVKSDKVTVQYGTGYTDSTQKLPYDYTQLGAHVLVMQVSPQVVFTFHYHHRFETRRSMTMEKNEAVDPHLKTLQDYEQHHQAVYCGYMDDADLFYHPDNTIHQVRRSKSLRSFTVVDYLAETFHIHEPMGKMAAEFSEIKIQDRTFPVIFLLGYRYGLTRVIETLKHPTEFIPRGEKLPPMKIQIPFADGTLVFDRYPLKTSLILAGLSRYDLSEFTYSQFEIGDGYFVLLKHNNLSTNYLKGIDRFFELFVDPITRDVLQKMGEPTTFPGLLIRATEMVADDRAAPPSSMENFRVRGYERLADVLYNELSRTYANWSSRSSTRKQSLSLNPEAVFLRIMQDPTLQIVESINPIHDLKHQTTATYTGSGGRTQRSFVVGDRRYPDDAVGILSEATPDSGNVAITTYFTPNPNIKNMRGLLDTTPRDLEPTEMISTSSLLFPGATQDDGI